MGDNGGPHGSHGATYGNLGMIPRDHSGRARRICGPMGPMGPWRQRDKKNKSCHNKAQSPAMSRGRWTGVASSRGGQRHGLKMYAPTIFGRRPKKRVLCVFNHRPNFPLKNLHYLCSPDLVKEPTLGDSSPLVFHFFLDKNCDFALF